MVGEERHLEYDPNIYFGIVETGRLVEVNWGALKSLGLEVLYDPNYLERIKDKKVGPDLIFKNK